MKRLSTRFGVTGVLALAVMVLVPLLAVLQYRWLGQLSEGERERMQRTLTTAAQQLAREVDNEIGRALTSLQLDATTVERQAWDVVAQRYDTWAASAASPDIVEAMYLAAYDEHAAPALTLLAWNPDTRQFAPAEWPAALAGVRTRLDAHVLRMAGRDDGLSARERMLPPSSLGDERTLVAPVMRVTFPEAREGRMTPPDMTLIAFSVIALDVAAVAGEVLPAAVRRHFYDADGTTEYRIAVVDRDDETRVIFASDPGALSAVATRHDASIDFMSPRPGGFMFATRGRGPEPPPAVRVEAPPEGGETSVAIAADRFVVNVVESRGAERTTTVQTRMMGGRDGHWRLLVAHQSGSLDAAVAAARMRNLLLSSGILALLTVAVGLIVGSARRAQDLARQQMEFVAAVSHELRTPVAVINSAAGNLADGVVGDPARVRTYGQTIQGEARRLGETVERVLQLAGLESGRGPAAGVVGTAGLIHEAIEACRLDVAKAGAQVEVDVAPDTPAILGDAPALRSAVQNLVSNAVKYGGARPWVRVTSRAGREGRSPAVLVTVEDRGLGIAAEDRAHVFEPFYRGREAVAQQIQGSGLGLSLVSRIAAAHGGRVTLESEPGRGSRFTLHLPAAPDGAAADPVAGTHPVTQRS